MTHLYLIRHGESFANVAPIVGGMRGDKGLTPRGVTQAERLRDRLAASGELQADVLIASTLPRARQTAEIIAPALDLPIVFDDAVQELRPGIADGLTLDQLRERYGRVDFEADPYRPLSPGGESWAFFLVRVATALTHIATEHAGQTIVIVCHGGVIDGSFQCFAGMNLVTARAVDFATENTSITHWQWRAAHGRPPRWRLMGYNDAAHLRGAPDEESSSRSHPAVPLDDEAEESG
ncbi:MAG TPA: histidine phosphatase family protein [Ktedonobacterales bacterium]|nr:histidine phosphatase family protein [Ktedonobacterales bacterium]